MADDVTLNAGTGGDTLAADDVAGVKYQRVKISVGADGSAADNSTAAPLAVKISDGTDVALVTAGGALTVDASAAAVPVTDNGGNLSIDDGGNSITVDNGGTFAVQESGTHVQADDAAFTPATSKVMMAGFTFDDVAPDSVNEGDGGAARMSANRNVYVNIRDNAGNERGLNIDANGEIQISGSRNALTVSSHAVTNAGTFVVQENGAALTSLQLIDDVVVADDAAFTPGTTKVLMIGATADETSPDSVNEGDGGALRMTLDRFLRVVVEESDTIRANGTSRSVTRTAVAAATSGNNTLVTNSNVGLTIRVYAMTLVAAAAVSIYFTADNAGTVIFGGSTNKISLAANSGFVLPYNPLGWFDTSANTDVVMNLSGAVAVSGGIVTAEV